MDNSDLVYVEVDAATITAASLSLGMDEGGLVESLSNHAIYEGRRLSINVHAPGALGRGDAGSFYRDILRAPEWVIRTVEEGYSFPFDQEVPPTVDLKNNRSAEKDPDFVWAELLRLECLGCTKRVSERPIVILPLSMVFSKKMRLVVDASRGLNPYLLKRDVPLEGLDTFAEILKKGDFVAIDDLDSGYWQVPLHPDMYQYCGVHYQDPLDGGLGSRHLALHGQV